MDVCVNTSCPNLGQKVERAEGADYSPACDACGCLTGQTDEEDA